MDEDRPGTERHLQRSIRRRGDPQAEEADSEDTVRRDVRSGLHKACGRPARDASLSHGRSRDRKVRTALSARCCGVIRPAPFLFAIPAPILGSSPI